MIWNASLVGLVDKLKECLFTITTALFYYWLTSIFVLCFGLVWMCVCVQSLCVCEPLMRTIKQLWHVVKDATTVWHTTSKRFGCGGVAHSTNTITTPTTKKNGTSIWRPLKMDCLWTCLDVLRQSHFLMQGFLLCIAQHLWSDPWIVTPCIFFKWMLYNLRSLHYSHFFPIH